MEPNRYAIQGDPYILHILTHYDHLTAQINDTIFQLHLYLKELTPFSKFKREPEFSMKSLTNYLSYPYDKSLFSTYSY